MPASLPVPGSCSTAPIRRGGRLPTSRSWRRGRSRSRSTPRTRPSRPSTSSETPAPRWRSSAGPSSTRTCPGAGAGRADHPRHLVRRRHRPGPHRSCPLSVPLAHPVSPAVAERAAAATLDDLATIIYTSGTTGEPKGVDADVREPRRPVRDARRGSSRRGEPTGRSASCRSATPTSAPGRSTFSDRAPRTSTSRIPSASLEAMQEVRPTCMVSVPRLYEKIYATARHKAEPGLGRASAGCSSGRSAWRSRYAHARKRGERVGPLLARAARARRPARAPQDPRHRRRAEELLLGGRRRAARGDRGVLLRGRAAGLPGLRAHRDLADADRATRRGDFKFGTVGKPIPGFEIKIAADGEILARGPNVMQGYYGKPEETAEAFEDGWFKTGDIGAFDADGFLRITDRKKDLIITSGGKNIAPSRIESIIGAGLLHRAGRGGRRRAQLRRRRSSSRTSRRSRSGRRSAASRSTRSWRW